MLPLLPAELLRQRLRRQHLRAVAGPEHGAVICKFNEVPIFQIQCQALATEIPILWGHREQSLVIPFLLDQELSKAIINEPGALGQVVATQSVVQVEADHVAGGQGEVLSHSCARSSSDCVDAGRWFFGAIKRTDAEKQLLYSENQTGAFLIRESESQKGDFALSVLDEGVVKHYRIRRLDEGGFFLARRRTFPTLNEFVSHYTKTSDGLCVKLGKPCLKIQVPAPFDLSYKTVDQWEIDRSSIQLLKRLGSGQFGEVWEGLWNNTTPVAVKTLKPGSMDPNDFLREAQIMKNLRHPKLIQLYAVCTLEDPIYIITELMRHGSLQEYLQNDAGSKIHLTQQVDMAAQVASGMAYLESQNYIHRDLAARNVLVGEHNIYKVADFGLARVFKVENEDIYESKHEIKLPVKWTAPEAIRTNKFSIKSDVWSFGILLYEIITYGKMPYSGMTGAQVIQMLGQNYRLPQPSNCPLQFYNIMLECWNAEPKDRPTFETLHWKFEDYFVTESSYSDTNNFL